ncbi:MAG: hypothetical protein N3G19_03010, partial [Candidatus Pacearchaeota archaeon]|nr:hypothetical protein [Candidatus Pacearchaeota archaeon]
MDLKETIEKDTAIRKDKFGKKIAPRVDIKIENVTLLRSSDPDLKQIKIDFSKSYDNRTRTLFSDIISVEEEDLSSDEKIKNYARKYFESVVKCVEKKGIISVKYPKDRYVLY